MVEGRWTQGPRAGLGAGVWRAPLTMSEIALGSRMGHWLWEAPYLGQGELLPTPPPIPTRCQHRLSEKGRSWQ